MTLYSTTNHNLFEGITLTGYYLQGLNKEKVEIIEDFSTTTGPEFSSRTLSGFFNESSAMDLLAKFYMILRDFTPEEVILNREVIMKISTPIKRLY
jgi:hypothetical protein